jgi:hypothetical protein
MRFVVRSSIVLVVFWFNAAAAQEGYLGHDHDKWHRGFYQSLLRPDAKTPCCNLTDCRPTSGKRVDMHYEVKVNGAWYPFHPAKF